MASNTLKLGATRNCIFHFFLPGPFYYYFFFFPSDLEKEKQYYLIHTWPLHNAPCLLFIYIYSYMYTHIGYGELRIWATVRMTFNGLGRLTGNPITSIFIHFRYLFLFFHFDPRTNKIKTTVENRIKILEIKILILFYSSFQHTIFER